MSRKQPNPPPDGLTRPSPTPAPPFRAGDGPAFSGAPQGHVSLRDYFAGQAIAGLCAKDRTFFANGLADDAYLVADAMLRLRERAK